MRDLFVKLAGDLNLVVQGEVESSMDRFIDELIEQTVFTKNYLVLHHYRVVEYFCTGRLRRFNFPAVSFFPFIKHDTFFFRTSK